VSWCGGDLCHTLVSFRTSIGCKQQARAQRDFIPISPVLSIHGGGLCQSVEAARALVEVDKYKVKLHSKGVCTSWEHSGVSWTVIYRICVFCMKNRTQDDGEGEGAYLILTIIIIIIITRISPS